jgi:4-carboxymuconolactone decarboxylase
VNAHNRREKIEITTNEGTWTMKRVELVTLESATPEQRSLLEETRPSKDGGVNVWSGTLANNAKLAQAWNHFGNHLIFKGSIPGRDREVLSLRGAFNAHGSYPWSSHARYGLKEGLSSDEIVGVGEGSESEKLGSWERTLVRAADELHADNRVSDETWKALSERYDASQLLEACTVVGQYNMLSWVLNSADVSADGAELGKAQ